MNKKSITGWIILLFLISSSVPFVSSYEVSTNNIIYVDDDGGADYTRIQDAIDNANDGDTIFVYNGSYEGDIVIKKSIFLIGENANSTIIDSYLVSREIFIKADNVLIQNFRINNDNKTVRGISIYKSKNIRILENNIINCTFGLYIKYSNSIIVIDNYINNFRDTGIFIEYSSFVGVTNNLINTVNQFYFNEKAITVRNSNNNIISNNHIVNNSRGIYLFESSKNKVYSNNIENSTVGIFTAIGEGVRKNYSNNMIYKNNITNNKEGILLYGGFNYIFKNNFLNNRKPVSFLDCRNTWFRNYWNESRFIYPILGEKLVNISGYNWKIPWYNFDLFPAKEPYDIP